MRYVVTGTSRGIGLEFVRQLLARGDQVVAGARAADRVPLLQALQAAHPRQLLVLPCDVTDAESVATFAAAGGQEPVDVLINNAGLSGSKGTIDDLEFDALRAQFEVNAVGPLRVTTALLPALRRGQGRKIANIGSERASLHNNTTGGRYPYRMSKAALNAASRSLAADLKAEGLAVVVLHPGWVQTRMGGPEAPVPVPESVTGMLRVLDSLTVETTGRFVDYLGHEIPW